MQTTCKTVLSHRTSRWRHAGVQFRRRIGRARASLLRSSVRITAFADVGHACSSARNVLPPPPHHTARSVAPLPRHLCAVWLGLSACRDRDPLTRERTCSARQPPGIFCPADRLVTQISRPGGRPLRRCVRACVQRGWRSETPLHKAYTAAGVANSAVAESGGGRGLRGGEERLRRYPLKYDYNTRPFILILHPVSVHSSGQRYRNRPLSSFFLFSRYVP